MVNGVSVLSWGVGGIEAEAVMLGDIDAAPLDCGKLHPAGLALLKGVDAYTYDYVEEVSEASYAPLIGKADALVIRTQPLSSATIADASRLKIVSRHGVGYD